MKPSEIIGLWASTVRPGHRARLIRRAVKGWVYTGNVAQCVADAAMLRMIQEVRR